jgi:hypothetical protein
MRTRFNSFIAGILLTLGAYIVAWVLPMRLLASVHLWELNAQSAVVFLLCVLLLFCLGKHFSRLRPATAVVGGVAAFWVAPPADTSFFWWQPFVICPAILFLLPSLLFSAMGSWSARPRGWLYEVIEPYLILGIFWLISVPCVKEKDLAWRWLIFYLWAWLALPSTFALGIFALPYLWVSKHQRPRK